MKAEQRAAADGAFEPGRGGTAASWRGAAKSDNRGGRGSSLRCRGKVFLFIRVGTGNDYPSAGQITAGSPGQKQARIKERTEASYPATNHPLAFRDEGLVSPTPACQSGVWGGEGRNHKQDSHWHRVMEDDVGPAEVIYGSEKKHFLDVWFIHLSLF